LKGIGRGIAALLLLAAPAGCARRLSEAQMFQPRPGPALTAELVAITAPEYTFEPLTLTTADGTRLAGGLLRRAGADRTVIYYGGNIATAARTGLRTAARLVPLDVNVVLVDYRGYGGSGTGPVSAETLLDDGLLVFDHVAGLPGLDPSRVVVHGHSMGSLVAGHVAANRATAGVVLESSATTTEDFVRTQIPWYGRPFVRMEIAPDLRRQGNLQQMGRIEEPLLLLVGSRDNDTPPRFSRSLYDASSLPPSRKQLVVIEGAAHSDVLERSVAISAYRAFLQLTRA
jgi:hypothetical protein